MKSLLFHWSLPIMHRGRTPSRWLLVAALWLGPMAMVAAQEPAAPADPFAEEAPKSAPAARPAAESKEAAPDTETDPNVLAIRASNPQTAADLTRAIENLLNLSRPEEARKYLRRLNASNFEPPVLWSLQRMFGSGLFFRLSADESIQPEGRTFADAVLNAAVAMTRDPARLEALIRQLSDPSREVRLGALVELRAAGSDAAVALIGVLADAARSQEHGVAAAALARLERDAEGPLLGALEAPDARLREGVLVALARLNSRAAIPFLLRPALAGDSSAPPHKDAAEALEAMLGRIPSRATAERYLYRQALAHYDGQAPEKADHENLVRTWQWDDTTQRPVFARLAPREVALRAAGQVARELTLLVPDNAEYRQLYLAARLEDRKLRGGLNQPLARGQGTVFQDALQLGTAELERILDFALHRDHPAGAVAACEVLGETRNRQMLMKADGHPSVLCRALQHAERRVRFAALQAVLRINPPERFPGASFVPEALGYFASTSEAPRVLVVHPRAELGQTLGGTLQGIGYQAEVASTGMQGLEQASRSSDFEFVLVSDAVAHPGVREFVQLLRREPRTARLPVAVLAQKENFDRMQLLTEQDPLALTFTAPYEPEGMAFLVGRLREKLGAGYVTAEERLRQAAWSLDALAALASKPERYGFYDLVAQQSAVERATATPQLNERAAKVLGLLATPSAQRWLVSLASQNRRPLSERQAAAQAFELAVQRRGVLLTHADILAQYDRYNASATLDQETQQVLGALLDSIESPGAEEESPPGR